MRVYYGLLVALLLLAQAAQAQRVLLGLKGGATISNGIGADATRSTLRFGGEGGALLRVQLYRQFSLQAEALYTQRGDNSTSYGPSIGHRLDYLTIPVLLQYHYDDIFFEAGPQFGRLLSATPVVAQLTTIGDEAFRSRDAGFAIGFGYQDTTGLTVGWRYNGGLNNVYRRVELAGSSQVQLRNSSVELYLAYLFEPRDAAHLAVGTGKLVFIKTPVLLFKGGKFLLYTGPKKLVRGIGQLVRPVPAEPAPSASPAPTPVPAKPTPPLPPSN